MNDQKDIQKTDIHTYGHTSMSDTKSVENKGIYAFANKKTEKLVTAMYMVTDCMGAGDALKSKLRILGVELLSDTYKLATLSPLDIEAHISATLTRVHETLSFIEIAATIGFISDMNASILKREFATLAGELQSHLSKDSHFTFSLNQSMFETEEVSPLAHTSQIHTDSIGHTFKKTLIGMSVGNSYKTSNSKNILTKKERNPADLEKTKEERIKRIFKIIKDIPAGHLGASIKDISTSFTDCSEKTIQRELNSLVSKGLLKKTGSKRWSRYSIA